MMNERATDLLAIRTTPTETPTKLKKLPWHAPQVRTISSGLTSGKLDGPTEFTAMGGGAFAPS